MKTVSQRKFWTVNLYVIFMKNLYFYRKRLTESMNLEKKQDFFFGLFKNGKMLSKVTYF